MIMRFMQINPRCLFLFVAKTFLSLGLCDRGYNINPNVINIFVRDTSIWEGRIKRGKHNQGKKYKGETLFFRDKKCLYKDTSVVYLTNPSTALWNGYFLLVHDTTIFKSVQQPEDIRRFWAIDLFNRLKTGNTLKMHIGILSRKESTKIKTRI